MNKDSFPPAALSGQLVQTLKCQDLVLYYQPQLEMGNERVAGMEALLRWWHPQRGLEGPVEFIRYAEQTGQILVFGEWILHSACRQLRVWRDAGFKDLRMAVNISPLQLQNSELVESVARALRNHGIAARLLELEITENAPITDIAGAVDTMRALQALGVKLAIDDFGTGHSTLSYLKSFRADRVKLDRLFVRDYPNDNDNEDIELLRGAIDLIHGLGIEVVAEGVENEAQIELLSTLGCDTIQGFAIAQPMSAAACISWLRYLLRSKKRASPGAAVILPHQFAKPWSMNLSLLGSA